ncbi:glycosyltransferase [Pseudolysinimonas sp.]|uniref:glycosyltransferase n=1 Tax=Pseudolysinimonas sp. TaxID=2680009 RepID=UPI0037842FFF
MTTFGFLSTYPPTRCGLATFTAALASAVPGPGDPDSRVVRVDDLVPAGAAVPGRRTAVVGDLRPGSVDSRVAAARSLDACDVVIVQHEYGIYGGPDGDEILDVLARIAAPCVVVLHTVRESPTAHQRWLLERVAGLASAVVVMTRAGADLLERRYAVDASKVHVIPHGVTPWVPVAVPPPATRPTVLTWGLIGPGKGIEWGIRALADRAAPRLRPRYVVAGQTHPKVLLEQGEVYRDSLADLARDLGVQGDLVLDGHYRDTAELAGLVAGADIVLLPYDSREQTTSGVLVEALAAGKPVIATRFPHAVELLSGGAGILVDHENPAQIAAALTAILGRRELVAGMKAAGAEESHETGWAEVGAQYRLLGTDLLRAAAA